MMNDGMGDLLLRTVLSVFIHPSYALVEHDVEVGVGVAVRGVGQGARELRDVGGRLLRRFGDLFFWVREGGEMIGWVEGQRERTHHQSITHITHQQQSPIRRFSITQTHMTHLMLHPFVKEEPHQRVLQIRRLHYQRRRAIPATRPRHRPGQVGDGLYVQGVGV